MRGRSWVLLTGLVLISAACGGRLIERGDDDGDGATNAGGSGSTGTGAGPSGSGAASSGGKATGVGGMASGTGGKATGVGGKASGVAGTASVGGGGAVCPDIPCKNVTCAPNQARVPTGDGCCFYCESVCPPCPEVGCAPGSHQEVVPGACCPICVADTCEVQRQGYLLFSRQLYEKYSSLGCMVNTDCSIYFEKNNCNLGCGVSMPLVGVTNLDSNLQSYAQQNCSPNCMVGTPGCAPNALPVCVQGRCQ